MWQNTPQQIELAHIQVVHPHYVVLNSQISQQENVITEKN